MFEIVLVETHPSTRPGAPGDVGGWAATPLDEGEDGGQPGRRVGGATAKEKAVPVRRGSPRQRRGAQEGRRSAPPDSMGEMCAYVGHSRDAVVVVPGNHERFVRKRARGAGRRPGATERTRRCLDRAGRAASRPRRVPGSRASPCPARWRARWRRRSVRTGRPQPRRLKLRVTRAQTFRFVDAAAASRVSLSTGTRATQCGYWETVVFRTSPSTSRRARDGVRVRNGRRAVDEPGVVRAAGARSRGAEKWGSRARLRGGSFAAYGLRPTRPGLERRVAPRCRPRGRTGRRSRSRAEDRGGARGTRERAEPPSRAGGGAGDREGLDAGDADSRAVVGAR